MAIWERALTAAEIASLYRDNKAGKSLTQILAAGRPTVRVRIDKDEARRHRCPAALVITRDSKQGVLNVRLGRSGWAESGVDYRQFPDLLAFPDGSDELRLEVFPVADKTPKGRRSLEVTLEDSACYAAEHGAKSAKAWIVGADWGKPRLPKKIYGHYMGCFVAGDGAIYSHRTSGLGTMGAPADTSETLPPLKRKIGAFAKHSFGGTYRNFDLAPKENLKLEEAADLEIRRAMRIGLDGFTFDAWAGDKGAMQLLDAMFKICEEKDYPFELTITPDGSCINPKMPELKPYSGDGFVKSVKWLLDRHGKSPKLARRDGKPLILGYDNHWECHTVLADAARKKLGPNATPDQIGDEVNRLRVCAEGWKLMPERFRQMDAEIGQPIYWEMDLGGTGGFFHPGNFNIPGQRKDLLIQAERIMAPSFPAFGAFLGGDESTRDQAKVAIAAGREWSQPILLQYENYGWYQAATWGTNALRDGWEEARNIPSTLMQYITWNDYHETTNLTPGINSRYSYFDLTGYYIRWWKDGVPPVYDHDKVYIFSHKYPAGAKTFPFQRKMDIPNCIEVVSILTKPARLRAPGRRILLARSRPRRRRGRVGRPGRLLVPTVEADAGAGRGRFIARRRGRDPPRPPGAGQRQAVPRGRRQDVLVDRGIAQLEGGLRRPPDGGLQRIRRRQPQRAAELVRDAVVWQVWRHVDGGRLPRRQRRHAVRQDAAGVLSGTERPDAEITVSVRLAITACFGRNSRAAEPRQFRTRRPPVRAF